MQNILVSVILPAHNGEKYIAKAIESVLNQEEQNFELFVLDNGSQDETGKIARSFPHVQYSYSKIASVAIARNEGIARARGEWIAFIDQDDLWLPHKLSAQLSFFATHPEFQAAVAHQEIFIEKGYTKPHWLKQEFVDRPHLAYIPSTLMVRKNIFAQTGPFDSTYTLSSDAAWFFTMKQLGISIGEMEEVVLRRRIHLENATNDWLNLQKELLLIIKRRRNEQKD